MFNQGWIKLYRQIQDCLLWDSDEPFDYRSAWIDLLLLANHDDKKIMFNGNPMNVKRGQKITSVRKLSERWGWSTKKTTSFLNLLESENMVTKESDNKKTLLTIVNYEFYQDCGNAEETQKKRTGDTEETQKKRRLPTNKNEKNEKNEKNIKDIVEYLNEKVGKKYRADSKSVIKLINGRLSENYTLDDFKKVIDNKCADWLGDDKMNKFLRPETLFAQSHFESYLNQGQVKLKDFSNRHNYDFAALQKMIDGD